MRYRRLRDLTLHIDTQGALILRSQAHGLGARVPPPSAAILAFCTEPRTRDEVGARFGPQMAQLFDGLREAGFLVDPDAADDTPTFFANFAGLEIHRRMLADRVRVDAYADAIARVVQPGMAVMDAGTGSGLLAMLAARAGARVVYAVDNSDVLELAEASIHHQDLQDTIRIVRGDFARVELPEKVDVIVSETFGAFALAEGSVPDLAAAVARHLAPGGRVVPDGVRLCLAPVGDDALFDETVGPFDPYRGVDFTPLRGAALHRGRVVDVGPASLLHAGGPVVCLPYPSDAAPTGTLELTPRQGRLTGFVAWFDASLGDDTMFSTAPSAPDTHWRQVYLPVEPCEVDGQTSLRLDLDVRYAPDDRRSLEVEVTWTLGANPSRSQTWRVR